MEDYINSVKEVYHLSRTWGEFSRRLGENFTAEEKEEMWTYLSQQPTYKIKIKAKK
jgi:hypothetical protein